MHIFMCRFHVKVSNYRLLQMSSGCQNDPNPCHTLNAFPGPAFRQKFQSLA